MVCFLLIFASVVLGQGPDPGQKTTLGCTCASACGYSIDFGVYDWCYTQNKCGRFSTTRQAYYDYCVFPPNRTYEVQSASKKLEILWDLITENQTGGVYPDSAGLFGVSMKTLFDDISDIAPAGRKKFVHSVGSVGQVEFVPVRETPYTGFFRTGAKHALLRASSAGQPSKEPLGISPSLSFKFFVSGRPSVNWLANHGGQSSFNFFQGNFSSHIKGKASPQIVAKFSEASNCFNMVGFSHVASETEEGPVSQPVFPYEVIAVPTGKIAFPDEYCDAETLGKYFEAIPVGSVLFEIYARETPLHPETKLIGSIISRSKLVKSTFGDERLFFRHKYMENDFKLRPEWLEQIDKEADCGNKNVTTEPPNPPPRREL